MDLESLVRNAHGIRALARSLLRDDAEADDVVQEAYLAALRKPPSDDVPLHAWLVGVVRNLALKRRRTEARIARRQRAAARSEGTAPGTEVTERAEVHRELMRALMGMAQPYRTTLLLRYFDGLSLKAIAQRLDVPVATVGTHIHRGLAQLRRRLDREKGGRDRWRLALLPLVGLPQPTLVPALGAVAVTTKKTFAVATAVVIAILMMLGLWHMRAGSAGNDRSTARASQEAAPAEVAHEESGLPAPIDFALINRDRDLHGVVVGRSGAPVAGASIETFWFPWRRAMMRFRPGAEGPELGPRTTSASDGTFLLRLRRGQRVNLRARASGHGATELAHCQAGERVRLVLGESAQLDVDVVDEDGRGVSGVTVRLFKGTAIYPVDRMIERAAQSDAGGHCRFEDLPSDCWAYLETRDPAYANGLWTRVNLPPGAAGHARIVLRRGRVVTGRVIDRRTGEGIEGAEVGSGWTIHRPVKTRADGSFDYPGWSSEGVVYMAARARGYERGRLTVGPRETVEFALNRGSDVRGRVVDPSGQPVEGARLSLRARNARSNFVTYQSGVTDAAGAFLFEGAGRGAAHTLAVVANGFGRQLIDFDVADEALDLGAIRLGTALRIEGRVVVPDGVERAGILVRLEGANSNRGALRPDKPTPYKTGGQTEQRRTDDLGRFRFPDLAPGHYTVAVEPSGCKGSLVDVRLREGEPQDDLTVVIPGGHDFTVRIVDPAGDPIWGVSAQIHMPDDWSLQQTTDATGVARFNAHLPVARVTLFDFDDRFILPAEKQVEDGVTEARFVLERSAEIRGIVRTPDGAVLPQAAIRIEQDGRPVAQQGGGGAWSDLEGRFRIRLPQRGVFDLFLSGAVNRIDGVNDDAPTNFTGVLRGVTPGATDLVLQAVTPTFDRSLRVRVSTPHGAPWAHVQVFANHMGKLVPGANVLTDAAGWATLNGLPNADIAVYARVPARHAEADAWMRHMSWPIRADGQELEVVLRRTRHLRGNVKLGERSIEGAFVSLYKSNRMLANVRTGAAGEFHFKIERALKGPVWIHTTWVDEAGTLRQARVNQLEPSDVDGMTLQLTPDQ